MTLPDATRELLKRRQRFLKDDIEEPEPPAPEEELFLTEKQLRFVAAWAGNLIAAARAAGCKRPKDAAYKLMKDANVVAALQAKQKSMLQESGEHLARTLPLSRADVIDRLWQLAQLSPEQTKSNITGQVKAAQALEQIFTLNIDRVEVLRRELQGKSEDEIEFYVVHGFLPHPEHQEPQEPGQLQSAEVPQLPASTTNESPTAERVSEAAVRPDLPRGPKPAPRQVEAVTRRERSGSLVPKS